MSEEKQNVRKKDMEKWINHVIDALKRKEGVNMISVPYLIGKISEENTNGLREEEKYWCGHIIRQKMMERDDLTMTNPEYLEDQ